MLSAAAKRLEAQELIAAVTLALAAAMGLPGSASAQTPPSPPSAVAPDPALRSRANALVPILAGEPGFAALFSPAFQAAVPEPRFAALAAQLRAAMGAPRRVERIDPVTATTAIVTIAYDRGSATMQLAIDPAAPHVVTGLRVTTTALRDDTLAKV